MRQSSRTLSDEVTGDANPHPQVGKLLLTYEESRFLLGCSLTTLKGLVKTGELRSIALTSKSKRIPVEALHEFIASRAVQADVS